MTHLLKRTALILLAGSALAACTTTSAPFEQPEPIRPNYPTRLPPGEQPPTTTAPPVREEPPVTAPRPLPPVQSQPLPSTLPPAAPTPAPEPQYRNVTRTTAAGRVVEAEGPATSYTVKAGDNLDAIARTLGTTRQQLADDNDLKPPYSLRPGQVLKGPTAAARAYIVESGDTLFAIARRFSVSAQAIAEANEMTVETPLSVGRRLVLPTGFSDRGPSTVTVRVPVDGSFPTQSAAPAPAPYTPPPSRPPVQEAPPPAPATTTRTRTLAGGKVSEITVPGESYTVKAGDNLAKIARTMDTTVEQLADDNKLKAPYPLKPGQTLKGPSSKAKAYTTVAGDTLEVVARRFNVTVKALAQANDLGARATLRAGRRLTLPDGYRDRGPIRETVTVPVETPPSRSSAPTPTPTPAPTRPAPTPSRPQTQPQPPVRQPEPSRTPVTPSPQPPASSVAPTDAQISSLGRGRFIWPLRGDLLSSFGPKGTGQRNDGVNLRSAAGTTVRAAAAGDVVYAGDQVPGFGNLVLIKHMDGWVTAYGHLARVDVKMQQKVIQGQQIGQVGTTGGVTEPQLHFEVRYAPTPTDRARPIDPMLVLPK